jgi:ribosome modulation factor
MDRMHQARMWGTNAAQAGLVRADNPYRDPNARAAWLSAYTCTQSALCSAQQDCRSGTNIQGPAEAPQLGPMEHRNSLNSCA